MSTWRLRQRTPFRTAWPDDEQCISCEVVLRPEDLRANVYRGLDGIVCETCLGRLVHIAHATTGFERYVSAQTTAAKAIVHDPTICPRCWGAKPKKKSHCERCWRDLCKWIRQTEADKRADFSHNHRYSVNYRRWQ